MRHLWINIAHISISVFTNDDNVISYYKKNYFSRHLLPCYSISLNRVNKSTVELYVLNHAPKGRIFSLGNSIIACYKDISSDIRHLSYLLLYSIQLSLQKSNCYYVHAAALIVKGAGYLVIGESKAGKSTLALETEKKYQAKIIGDDGLIIKVERNKIRIIGGNSLILYDKKYDDRFFCCNDAKKFVAYNKNHMNANYTVEVIVFIKTDCICDTNSLLGNHKRELYEALSANILGLGYYYSPEGIVYPCLDKRYVAQERLSDTENILNICQLFDVKGTREYICKSFWEIIEKNVL